MTEHGLPYRETFLAEFARKPSLFVRLDSTLVCISSGRVVTLVVRVQLIDAVVVTVADLTHDVVGKASLKNKTSNSSRLIFILFVNACLV